MAYFTHFNTIAPKNYVHVKSGAQSQDTTLEKLRKYENYIHNSALILQMCDFTPN